MTKLLSLELLAFLTLFAVTWSAKADPTESQTGKLTCGPNACTDVTFPLNFGSPPATITLSSFGGCDAKIMSKTRYGFTAIRAHDFGQPFTCSYTAKGSYFLHNLSVAKYLILSVIYAPPGRSINSVTYSSSSIAGTSVSSSKTFTYSNSVSVGASGSVVVGGSANASFDASRSTTDTELLDVKKSTTTTIIRPGPAIDGIDHDEDQVWLLLNPPIDIAINPNTNPASISWQLGKDANKALITYLYVGQLNGHYQIPPGQQDLLDNAGITPSDFPAILARDPLAGANPYFDPNRFFPLEPRSTVVYTPPLKPSDPNIPITSTFNTTTTNTNTSSAEETYRVTLSLGADADFFSLAQVNMKDTQTWTWSNRTTKSSSTSQSDTIGYTIAGPSYGYTGPTQVEVLYDAIFHTFAFRFVQPSLVSLFSYSIDGVSCDARGRPISGSSVLLSQNGSKRRAYLNARGEFRFTDLSSSPAQLFQERRGRHNRIRASGVVAPVSFASRSVHLNLGPCGRAAKKLRNEEED